MSLSVLVPLNSQAVVSLQGADCFNLEQHHHESFGDVAKSHDEDCHCESDFGIPIPSTARVTTQQTDITKQLGNGAAPNGEEIVFASDLYTERLFARVAEFSGVTSSLEMNILSVIFLI